MVIGIASANVILGVQCRGWLAADRATVTAGAAAGVARYRALAASPTPRNDALECRPRATPLTPSHPAPRRPASPVPPIPIGHIINHVSSSFENNIRIALNFTFQANIYQIVVVC